MKLESSTQLQPLPGDTSQNYLMEFRDADLEAAYQADCTARTVLWHRVLWSVSTLLWIALLVNDRYTAGGEENVHVVRLIRITTAIPAAIAVTSLGWASAPVFARWRVRASIFVFCVHLSVFVYFGAALPHPEQVTAPGNAMGVGVLLFGLCMWCAILRLPQRYYVTMLFLFVVATSRVSGRFPIFAAYEVRFWFLVSIGVGIFIARQLERSWRVGFMTHRLLELERARSDQLLRSVLPLRIAERLKHDRTRIAERYEEVTVLFADLVGFTSLSNRLSAEQIVDKLDDIFSRFDDIAQRHGLEKIKTIGDAYMVVSGVPTARPDHAHAIVAMALEMLTYVEGLTIDGQKVGMRVGVHSGPVVAGVIGKQKFTFDVWGDTVNVASRMESHGLPGCIQITGATKEALDDAFPTSPRGTVDVKGVGPMQTWLVTRP